MPSIPNSSAPQPVRDVLDAIEIQFELSDQKLKEITAHFVKMYQFGLQHSHEPMAMIPSYVTAVPDGSETGCDVRQQNLPVGRLTNLSGLSWQLIWAVQTCNVQPLSNLVPTPDTCVAIVGFAK